MNDDDPTKPWTRAPRSRRRTHVSQIIRLRVLDGVVYIAERDSFVRDPKTHPTIKFTTIPIPMIEPEPLPRLDAVPEYIAHDHDLAVEVDGGAVYLCCGAR